MDLCDLRLPKPRKAYGYVYHTTFIHPETGDVLHYVGQKTGSRPARKYFGSGLRITNLVNKYGRAPLHLCIVRWCVDANHLHASEVEFIAEARRRWGDMCINLLPGGRGGKHHPDTITKMRRPKNFQHVLNSAIARTGQKRTKESRERMKLAHLGVPTGPHAIVECPHCGKVGGDRSMQRWHFDRCPEKTGERSLPTNHEVNRRPEQPFVCAHCARECWAAGPFRRHVDACARRSL